MQYFYLHIFITNVTYTENKKTQCHPLEKRRLNKNKMKLNTYIRCD